MPGGYIPTQETKQRECWKFDTRDVNSEFESRVSVRPSINIFSKPTIISSHMLTPEVIEVPLLSFLSHSPTRSRSLFLSFYLSSVCLLFRTLYRLQPNRKNERKNERASDWMIEWMMEGLVGEGKVLRVLPSSRCLPRNQGWVNFSETRLVTVMKSLHRSCWTELTCQGI